MMSCLVIEDNPINALALQRHLTEQEFAVYVARDGQEALSLFDLPRYRIILLDLELPDVDGLTVLRRLRKRGVSAPIIIVSCHDNLTDRVEALRAGADDYVCKPYHPEELFARIRAKLRRQPKQVLQLRVADLELDCSDRRVRRGNTSIHLSSKQFAILELLMRNAGCPVSRDMIIEHIWNFEFAAGSNVVDVHVSQLRGKIDQGRTKALIHTVHGTGYMITDPDTIADA
jgi:DNA-binding response OmpR family regulator